MLLVACASTRPTTASAKYPQCVSGAVAAASRPPIKADVTVIEKTQARVIKSQRATPSIARPRGKFPVAMICRQLSSHAPGEVGTDSAERSDAAAGWLIM